MNLFSSKQVVKVPFMIMKDAYFQPIFAQLILFTQRALEIPLSTILLSHNLLQMDHIVSFIQVGLTAQLVRENLLTPY